MASKFLPWSLLLGALCFSFSESRECYYCSNVAKDTCNSTTICQDNEVCFLKTSFEGGDEKQTLGCEAKPLCDARISDDIVGRGAGSDLQSENNVTCHECCNTDLCNDKLCSHQQNTECKDDPLLDCARLSSLFSICNNLENAMTSCPNFCNLCPVDGGWSDWSEWSLCNATCEVGVQSRVRSCDNPIPENRGRNCDGEDVEYLMCSNNPCPVHGSWSVWSEWGTCSATCDVGIQRRDRHCSNPYPDKYGDHCFGDSRDDRICLATPCANGGWSSWEDWGSCSVTCGGGLQTKQRHCTNPPPSPYGLQCEGNNIDTKICATIGCKGIEVAFKAYNGGYDSSTDERMKFPTADPNIGHGYNTTTGIFTAPVNGLYTFYAQICISNNGYTYLYLRKNGADSSLTFLSASDVFQCTSTTTVIQLEQGDEMDVHINGNSSISHSYNQFSGYLIGHGNN